MGMFEFRLTLLLCSLTIYKSLDAASVLDNSSDLWRNWLLNENEEILSQQGPPLTRRITPKSVFIAPVFDKCPPGTRIDSMGKCVKIVRIDKWEILLNKLNAAVAQGSLKNETSTREPLGATTTTTMMTTTTTTTTTTTKMTTTDVPSSTLYGKENSTAEALAEDISGPFQLSIPLNAKNATDGTDDDSSPLYVRGNLTGVFNESEVSTTTTTTTTETENPNESVTEGYDSGDATTTLLPPFEVTLSTVYPDANTGSVQEFATEATTESTTSSPSSSSSSDFSTDVPSSSPKRYYVRRRPGLEQETGRPTSSRPPETLSKLTVTPVANLIYSYTSEDILKVPVRFPESSRKNESALHGNGAAHVGDFSTTNDSDISDSTISGSSSVSSSNNNVILGSSISSSKNDIYQKLPSNGKTRPKCDPISGYGDCAPDKTSYLMNANRGGGPPPVTTIIRFPATYTKGTSMVRFPTNGAGGGGGIVADQQQQQQHRKTDETVAFPDMEVGAASRYWESSRYPASYWNPWDPSKPHFVRIWPSNVAGAAATTYNMNSDVNYNYRSHPEDYS